MKGAIVGVGLTGGGKNGVEKVFGRGIVEEGVGEGLIFDCGGTGQCFFDCGSSCNRCCRCVGTDR